MEITIGDITLTPEYLEKEFGEAVYAANEYVRSITPNYIKVPGKPHLNPKHCAADVLAYADALKQYEVDYADYKIKDKEWREISGKISQIVELYVREVSGLNDIVPEQYRDKVYSLAYEEGHSNGFSEIYNYLLKFIDIFA